MKKFFKILLACSLLLGATQVFGWNEGAWNEFALALKNLKYSIIPQTTNTLTLGDATHKFASIYTTYTVIDSSGYVQIGAAGQTGSLKLYSEQGATDYTATLLPNTAMTSAASFYLPVDEPASTSIMYMTSGGVMTMSANLTTDGTSVLLNAATVGTSGTGVFAAKTGVAPTTSPADVFQAYSADWNGAGTASMYVRGEETVGIPIGQNLVNDAKGKMINAVYGVVTPANVKGFWIFDKTGATTAIIDRSTIGGTTAHNITLTANASTLSPSIAGMCPNLLMPATTNYFSAADDADFTATVGNPLSVMVLWKPTDVTATQSILAKDSATGREWSLGLTSSKVNCVFFDTSQGANYRGRQTDTVTDNATWVTYGFTYNGGTTSVAQTVWRNGVKADTGADYEAGNFTTMADTATVVSNSYGVTNLGRGAYGVVLIIKEELTATQARRLDAVLRAFAGSDLN